MQWQKLKLEVENSNQPNDNSRDLEALLLTGPTFSQRQLDTIEENRQAINQWRSK